jgi:hypothetical protein
MKKELRPKRALENRLAYCASCGAARELTVSATGSVVCSSCGLSDWHHLSVPMTFRFRDYNEREIRDRVTIDRYIRKIELEEFIGPTNQWI